MDKTKYAVISGFLGAGKTTAMIAFVKDINSRKVGTGAVLVDDLGASNIVDANTTAASGIISLDISGDCICYQHENLIDKLHQLETLGANVIFSDIPGLGIGALDNVYLQMIEREPGEFDLMPFTCLIDPERIRMIMPEQARLNLPEELKFLLHAQMKEADLIVLNKTDTITEQEKEKILAFVRENNPDAEVMSMSAMTGDGVSEVVDYMMSHQAAGQHKDIGYGSEAFMAAESRLSWYNQRVFLEQKEDKPLDFNQVITDLFEGIRKGLVERNANVPHLKMYASDGTEAQMEAEPENRSDIGSEAEPGTKSDIEQDIKPGIKPDIFKASLIGVDYDIEYASKLEKQYSALSLVINARAAADSSDMADAAADAIEAIRDKYDLKAKTFFLESFGMMEQGRGNMGRASKY